MICEIRGASFYLVDSRELWLLTPGDVCILGILCDRTRISATMLDFVNETTLTAFYRDSQRSGCCLLISLAPVFADKTIRGRLFSVGFAAISIKATNAYNARVISFSVPSSHTCLRWFFSSLKINSSVTNRRVDWICIHIICVSGGGNKTIPRGRPYFNFLWQSHVTPAAVRHLLVRDHGMDILRCFSSPLRTITVTKNCYIHVTRAI